MKIKRRKAVNVEIFNPIIPEVGQLLRITWRRETEYGSPDNEFVMDATVKYRVKMPKGNVAIILDTRPGDAVPSDLEYRGCHWVVTEPKCYEIRPRAEVEIIR